MPTSIASDNSLDSELAAVRRYKFQELGGLKDNAASQEDPSTPEDDEEEWNGIKSDGEDNQEDFKNNDDRPKQHDEMLPPNKDIPYGSYKLLLRRVQSHTNKQGYAVTIQRSLRKKGVVTKYQLRYNCGATYKLDRIKGAHKRDEYNL